MMKMKMQSILIKKRNIIAFSNDDVIDNPDTIDIDGNVVLNIKNQIFIDKNGGIKYLELDYEIKEKINQRLVEITYDHENENGLKIRFSGDQTDRLEQEIEDDTIEIYDYKGVLPHNILFGSKSSCLGRT